MNPPPRPAGGAGRATTEDLLNTNLELTPLRASLAYFTVGM